MKKILAIILDGFGIRNEVEGNAIKQAVLPTFNNLWQNYPHTLLNASGSAVGLPQNQMGNSEVGHMAIGSGRLIIQKELQIDKMFEDKILEQNEKFLNAINDIKDNNKKVHLMILCSDGGIHSQIKHLLKMLELLKEKEIKNIYFHLITDGRDTDIHSSFKYINIVKEAIKIYEVGTIATICGRYYAMDRDNKWERTKKYYDLITRGAGTSTKAIMKTIQTCYQKDITDEFLPPLLINEEGLIGKNDTLFWLNYRPDRARQILTALTNPDFNEFATYKMSNLNVYTFYPVDKKVFHTNFLENEEIKNPLGVYLANLGLTQARIAETEKYAHVTYFFDCEYPKKIDNCDKILIPSPQVATYDLTPGMSAEEVCKKTINCMEKDYDVIVTNFANPDMIGHTGNMEATIKAVQFIDLCLQKIMEAATDNFYTVFIFADHGNAELLRDDEGNIITSHTTNKVPLIITDQKVELIEGDITQIAPTILEYMDIAIPKEMKESLFKKAKQEEY